MPSRFAYHSPPPHSPLRLSHLPTQAVMELYRVKHPTNDAQVTDYLKKKGFTKTEAVFRQETAHLGPDGRPAQRNEENGPRKYLKAFILLRDWIENNLDIYKVRDDEGEDPNDP